jgi:undecaprenyl-diphosphatase
VAISGTIASLSKHMIGRARPLTGGDPLVFEFLVMSFQSGWAAFPSGHATTATACAMSLAIALPRHAFAWLSIGLLAALSRAFLGVHWLTDCLAGIALGALVCLAVRRWMEGRGHAFRVDPALAAQVLVKASHTCLCQAYRLAALGLRQLSDRVRQQFPARKP